jgi:integrase
MLVTEYRLLDAAGRRRSPATMPGYHAGRPPRNKGIRYPADPPRVEEIVSVMRQAGPGIHGARPRALIVVLWRAGLRISEALSLAYRNMSARCGTISVTTPPRRFSVALERRRHPVEVEPVPIVDVPIKRIDMATILVQGKSARSR